MEIKKYVDETQMEELKTSLADSIWQDIAGYSTTRRNIAQNSKLSAYSFTGSGDYCNKINDNTWSMKSSVQYAGNNITFRITVTPIVDLSDTSVSLGQLNLNKIGVTNIFSTTLSSYPFTTDAGHGIALVNVTSSGAINSVEVVPRNSDTTLDTDQHALVGIFTLTFPPEFMLDSVCNEFHWKRVS